ncbi:hypothetical protein CPAR01_13916 [Colletotrichum paranaense]|uniref:Uncharacterized protein n=1 Tax=Colletotrichum paranaense TaxID=1914294 RepID=A0ABQ9S2L2_9PEZI|nr:uncharacterized protein CPAR01_13916 [Colletotrichum paranaense]KAK1523063.1 hypothetical protein CPAR01_13916 [Colletotrichum paranaense]
MARASEGSTGHVGTVQWGLARKLRGNNLVGDFLTGALETGALKVDLIKVTLGPSQDRKQKKTAVGCWQVQHDDDDASLAGEPCQPRSQSVSVSRYCGRRESPTPTSVGLYAQDSETAPSLLVARHNLPLSDLIYAILRTEKHRSDIQYDAERSAAGDQTIHIRQQARHPGGTPRSIKLAVSACAVYRVPQPIPGFTTNASRPQMYLSTTLDEAHPTPILPISPVTSLQCSTAHHTIHYKHNSTPSWNLRDIRAAFQHEKQASHDATDHDVSPMTCLSFNRIPGLIVRPMLLWYRRRGSPQLTSVTDLIQVDNSLDMIPKGQIPPQPGHAAVQQPRTTALSVAPMQDDRLVDSILRLGANSLLAFPALVASVAAEFTQARSTAMAIASRPSR